MKRGILVGTFAAVGVMWFGGVQQSLAEPRLGTGAGLTSSLQAKVACSKCKKKNPASNKFCEFCGTAIKKVANTTRPTTPTTSTGSTPRYNWRPGQRFVRKLVGTGTSQGLSIQFVLTQAEVIDESNSEGFTTTSSVTGYVNAGGERMDVPEERTTTRFDKYGQPLELVSTTSERTDDTSTCAIFILPGTVLKAGSTWQRTVSAESLNGPLDWLANYRVTGSENKSGLACYKVSTSFKEKDVVNPATGTGTAWVSKADNDPVYWEITFRNMTLGGMPFETLKATLTRSSKS